MKLIVRAIQINLRSLMIGSIIVKASSFQYITTRIYLGHITEWSKLKRRHKIKTG